MSKESAPKILTVIVRPRLLTITCGDSSSKPVISLDDHHCSMSRGQSLTYRHIFLINHRQFFSHRVLPRGCQPCGARNMKVLVRNHAWMPGLVYFLHLGGKYFFAELCKSYPLWVEDDSLTRPPPRRWCLVSNVCSVRPRMSTPCFIFLTPSFIYCGENGFPSKL